MSSFRHTVVLTAVRRFLFYKEEKEDLRLQEVIRVKNEAMSENFMKEKPVLPLILSMALPMVISMLVNSLYNIVDSFFVAKISEDAMTALSLVYPVQNFINAVGIGFGVGMNALQCNCICFYIFHCYRCSI